MRVAPRGLRRLSFAATTVLIGGMAAVPGTAYASTSAPQGCPPDTYYTVTQVGSPWYSNIGNTAGKYNASSKTSSLRYSFKTTVSRSTSWGVEAGGSLSWAVASVEAKTKYDVTKKTSKSVTVTDILNVPGKRYGYVTPKVEYRKFVIDKWQDTAKCTPRHLSTMGTLKAITAYPFFAECVASRPCTPKP